MVSTTIVSFVILFFFTTLLLQGEPIDALPNVMTLDLAQVATKAKT